MKVNTSVFSIGLLTNMLTDTVGKMVYYVYTYITLTPFHHYLLNNTGVPTYSPVLAH